MAHTMLWLIGLVAATAGAEPERKPLQRVDWLVTPVAAPVKVAVHHDRKELTLENGLVRRTWRLTPNAACISLARLDNAAEFLRAVKPEGVITLDGQRYEVGGLRGQPDLSYLDPTWLDQMTTGPNAFQFAGHAEANPVAAYPWTPRFGAPGVPWPPRGRRLTLQFRPPGTAKPSHQGVTVEVIYEMYEGLPVVAKWLTVTNAGKQPVVIDQLETEILAVTQDQESRLYLESDYAFYQMNTTLRTKDPDYVTRAEESNYPPTDTPAQPLLIKSHYPRGPGVRLGPGAVFTSFRTFELLHDTDDRERRGLALRQMYRRLVPQAQENPIFMHVRSSESAAVRRAIDQCADVGFEMVILSFGSGFDMNTDDKEYIARFKADVDYAHRKGIKIGGYHLFCSSRSHGPGDDAIDPATKKPGGPLGRSLCLGAACTDAYFDRLLRFVDATGMDVLEADGPYHGYACASATHKYHRGLDDSQLVNWQRQVAFFHACRRRNLYVLAPDWYFFHGTNKNAMGYSEDNLSLPRDRQILIARQNIYDGTWYKTPSMGWMFVPLVEYGAGGPRSTLEPLAKNLAAYEQHWAQNFGSGVMAAYRGPRLYDTEQTKAVVKKWVDFYKEHRDILNSDIIHVRRPTGRDIDVMLHVNPRLKTKGLAMVYNPLDQPARRTLWLPLYYTGLTDAVTFRDHKGNVRTYQLDRRCNIEVRLEIPPRGVTWFTLE